MDITVTTLPSAAESAEQRRLQNAQDKLKKSMSLNNNKLAAFSNEDLLADLFGRSVNEGEAGREVASSDEEDAESNQQLKDAAAAAVMEEESASTANNNKKKPRKQKPDADQKTNGGGFNFNSLMMVAMLIFSLSSIHQIGGSGEGGAPPTLPPSASRLYGKTKDQSNNDNAASPEIIMSPLPASIVAPPPIFSPVAVSNHRMKIDKLRSAACLDTPNWKDVDGHGCNWYEEYDYCSSAHFWAGDMGPATEHCCMCGGGSVSLPPTNSPTISSSPTESAAPSTYPTIKPSSSPSISSNPTEFCLDTPNWENKWGKGCDYYEDEEYDSISICSFADFYAGDMGSATEHCCICGGGSRTCEDYRSTCQDYFDIVGVKDGVVSPWCEEAESCSCGDHDVKIVTDDWGGNYTVGLYNECKCDFWSRICEDNGARVGEACDYAAEYCCGDYFYSWRFDYMSSPTCYCDFYNYAQHEFEYALKPKAMNISREFENPCGKMEAWKWVASYTGTSESDERTSLEAIYEKTGGPEWTNNDGWMNETVGHCQWYGISCGDDEFGKTHITRIDLKDNNLAGQFPVYTRNYTRILGNPILESEWYYTKFGLANLYYLETVVLAGNKLTGTIDYRPLYNLALLKYFDVSGNHLSGGVDALVSPSIVHSDFSNNNFTSMRRFEKYKGSYQTLSYCDVSNNAIQINATDRLDNIPPNIKQFLAQNNQIYGSFPDSINNLPQLQRFDMSSNALTGSLLESLNNLPQLREFDMSSNALTGSLPDSLNNLPQLRQFNISSNALSGQLPLFAESILSLQKLDISNQVMGFTGSVPQDLERFQSLKILKLAGNKLTGTIPSSIGNIAVLEILDLSNNLLSSTIPPELGLLDGVLFRLDLSNNHLSGRIPPELSQLQGASILLSNNLFYNSSETAPLSLCMLSNVEAFDLENDTMLCPIERKALREFYYSTKGGEWTDSTNWVDEYTSYCNWTGVTCENDRVTILNLSNNGLSGRLSESIGNLTAIKLLDLSDNDIKGSIPTEIGLLFNLTYLRLSYNAFTGMAPEGLQELTKLQLLQLQSNRITKMPNITPLDDSIFNESTFITDCGVPSAFKDPMECDNCTMCCNANEDCYPQEDTRIEKWGFNSYLTFARLLIPCFIAICGVTVLSLYFFRKYNNRENTLTMSRERRIEEDDKYALSRIGKNSVYYYFVTDKALGWVVAFATLGIQVAILIFFVNASEANLQDDKIDIKFTWKCPRDSDECRDTADLKRIGWFIFSMLLIAHLGKDLINGSKLIYHSSRIRHTLGSRVRYFISGIGLCSITLFAIYVSTVYNMAIATGHTDIIINSVVVLFIMDLDEYIFALLEACNDKWTAHASDSEDTISDEEARNENESSIEITEMKEEIKRQKTQIASQQEELGILRSQQEELMLQRDQVARQNDEIARLREVVQQMQVSLVQSIPQSQSLLNESVTTQTAGLENDCSERDAGKDCSVNKVEDDLNKVPKDETAFEMKEQVIGRRRLEYPVMQNEFEDSQVEAGEDADTPDSENAVECEGVRETMAEF